MFDPINKRRLFMTDDPDFAFGTPVVIDWFEDGRGRKHNDGERLAATALIGIWTILDDDKTPVQKGLRVAGYSALSVVGGAAPLGSIARNVLVSKGTACTLLCDLLSFISHVASLQVLSRCLQERTNGTWNDVEPSEERQQIGRMLIYIWLNTCNPDWINSAAESAIESPTIAILNYEYRSNIFNGT